MVRCAAAWSPVHMNPALISPLRGDDSDDGNNEGSPAPVHRVTSSDFIEPRSPRVVSRKAGRSLTRRPSIRGFPGPLTSMPDVVTLSGSNGKCTFASPERSSRALSTLPPALALQYIAFQLACRPFSRPLSGESQQSIFTSQQCAQRSPALPECPF